MRNKQIKLKYKKMQYLFEDMNYLTRLGFAEYVTDPETGEDGWRIKPEGIKLLENMNQETVQES